MYGSYSSFSTMGRSYQQDLCARYEQPDSQRKSSSTSADYFMVQCHIISLLLPIQHCSITLYGFSLDEIFSLPG